MFCSKTKANIKNSISSLENREEVCWKMAKVFLENKDAHGIHDMGVEIQALQRAIAELKKIDI
jgi:hypothetical protein